MKLVENAARFQDVVVLESAEEDEMLVEFAADDVDATFEDVRLPEKLDTGLLENAEANTELLERRLLEARLLDDRVLELPLLKAILLETAELETVEEAGAEVADTITKLELLVKRDAEDETL